MYALPTDSFGKCQTVPKTDMYNETEFCRYVEKQRNETVEYENVDPLTNTSTIYNVTQTVSYNEPLTNHTYHDICMYCVVGKHRSLTGLLTMEWTTCNIQCDNGKIVSCSCMESNEV